MNENRMIGNVATRIRTVGSCVTCPLALRIGEESTECGARERIEWLSRGGAPVAAACPLKSESVFVALAASEVIR